jgi:hypothetical protein
MWILKGSLLGILIFLVFFAIRFHRIFYHTLIDPRVVWAITVHSVFFWLGLIGCVLVGCAIVGSWPVSAKV